MGFSPRYSPVAGRLHTRYAPVRRSPAEHCCSPLPLDLHVLSLPLAFILSQDQTLHCKNCFSFTFDSSRVPRRPPPTVLRHTLSHLSSLSMSFRSRPGHPLGGVPFPVESGCKDTTIFQTRKIFFRIFSWTQPLNGVSQPVAAKKNFHRPPKDDGKAPAKPGTQACFFQKSGVGAPVRNQLSLHIVVCQYYK